jgi:uncharacterized protein (TIRG00374 family)
MNRAAPAWVSRVAIAVGIVLFLLTLSWIDREATLAEARQLGLLLPIVLLPSGGWHVLRTLGWLWCFPADTRPTFWRLFRVRLAADAVSYFTVRGLASEPLRVVLLLDRIPAPVSTASTILERTAIGIMSVVLVASCAIAAMSTESLPDDWQQLFRVIAVSAVVIVLLTLLFLTRSGRYLGPLLERMYRKTKWGWTEGRVARFILDVEQNFLNLSRDDPHRLRRLVVIAVWCYILMMVEVWLVFWAIGSPISVWYSAIVETFTRVMSVPGGVIPANLGALEASNFAVVKALGLTGAGSLALARRVRGLFWAGVGLLLYPRDTLRAKSR